MKTTKNNPLYTDAWRYNTTLMNAWWKDYTTDQKKEDITEENLARALKLDQKKMTLEEQKALTTLLPRYRETQVNTGPDIEMWNQEIDDWLQNILLNLDKEVNGHIVGIEDAGLWNGRRNGFAIVGHNIKDIFNAISDANGFIEIWIARDGLHISLAHHDGTNYYLFRLAKDYDSARALQLRFLELDKERKPKKELEAYFKKHTKSLLSEIAEIHIDTLANIYQIY